MASPRPTRALAGVLPLELKPYLAYSVTLHVGLAVAAAAVIMRNAAALSAPIYTIDFVGPTSVMSAGPSAAPAAAKAAESRPASSELVIPKRRHRLPKPSLLSHAPPKPSLSEEEPEERPAATQAAAAAPQAAGSGEQAISGAPGSGGIVTDLPNFPYPWYISQVRVALWNQWSSRMPAERGLAVVSFSILRNGSVVDLRVEDSSGDSAFDLTAMAAAQDAGPFPPLPSGFDEPFLKVHVTLKSGA